MFTPNSHSWANAGVLLSARVRRRIAFETINYREEKLLSLLALAGIASKDERDIPSKFGVSTPALL